MHIFQVGVGSGGIAVLDALVRDPRVTRVTLVDPDTYEAANAARHLFPPADAGRLKVELAADHVRRFRPDLEVIALPYDLTDPARQADLDDAAATCDLGVCAADNEPAKYHFDALMRRRGKPWTLGEVLAGGVAGWVHGFVPGGACYGCVASFLERSVTLDHAPPPNYADPTAAVRETRIPAGKAAVAAIAGLHAVATLAMLEGSALGFTSLLMPLATVEGAFAGPFRPHRFAIPRAADCLACGLPDGGPRGGDLDVALDQVLGRLGHE